MELQGKTVLVYGCGKSGLGAAELLTKLGAHPVLFDENETLDRDQVLHSLAQPEKAELVLGKIPAELAEKLSLVVLSPGVSPKAEIPAALAERGLPIWGEVELAWQAGRGRVLAVTGTNGKTTTVSLLGQIMREQGRETFVVGNIGNAWTGAAADTHEDSCIVAEMSSFQLETIHTFRPHVSAILNITEDHLNRHGTMEEYIRVKERITENQTAEDVCVLNYMDPVLRAFGETCPARVIWFSSGEEPEEGFFLRDGQILMRKDGKEVSLIETKALSLIGVHNYENVMAASAMALADGADIDTLRKTLSAFKPVAHRIEYIAEKNGVIWYNDSKGTNPDAAIRGICAMERPTLLIAGGYDKGSDYTPWIKSFGGRVKYLVLEGKTKEDIRKAALSCGFPEERIVMRENMDEAMDFCRDHAEAGDAVLLSPACASWGEFPNYEVRGDRFREYVTNEI